MAYYQTRRFTIGGPGAHPDDIAQLFHDAGFEGVFVTLPDEKIVKLHTAMEEYMDTLIRHCTTGDWRFWRILASTSASSRTRILARGVEYPTGVFPTYPRSQPAEIPRLLRQDGWMPQATSSFRHFLGIILEQFRAQFRPNAPLTVFRDMQLSPQEVTDIFDQGGYVSESGLWISAVEMLQHSETECFWDDDGIFLRPRVRMWTTTNLQSGAVWVYP